VVGYALKNFPELTYDEVESIIFDQYGWSIAGKTSFWKLIKTAGKQSGLDATSVLTEIDRFGWETAGKASFWKQVANAKKWSGLDTQSVLDLIEQHGVTATRKSSFWKNLP
jgi:hypothetical protein